MVVTWQAALRKTKVILDLLTDIDVLVVVEQESRCRLCH